MRPQIKLIATIAATLLLLTGIYSLILTHRYVGSINDSLHQQDLSIRFDTILTLNENLNQREILLLQYYSNLDHEKFENAYSTANQNYLTAIKRLRRFPDMEEPLARLVTLENRVAVSATEFSRILASQEIDWKRARELLGGIAVVKKSIRQQLNTLAQNLRVQRLHARGDVHRITTQIQQLIYFLVMLLSALTLTGTWVFYKFFDNHANAKALALFPERNPNPILRLSTDGRVDFANPGAKNVLASLFPDQDSNPEDLFPPDMSDRLSDLQHKPTACSIFEYAINDRYFECTLQYLPDMDSIYAYITDITRRKTSEAELSYQAHHDSLTSLPNRRMLQNRIIFYTHNSTIDGEQTALLLLSLDRFNAISGSLGPNLADKLLTQIAARLKSELETSLNLCEQASIFRLENAIFAVLLHGFSNRSILNRIAKRFIRCMQNPVYIETKEYFTTISIGISIYPIDGTDSVSLLRNATSAMTRASQLGGNIECFYSQDMKDNTPENLSLENYLRYAIARNELELYYQPQISLATGKVVGAEAVLRWNHPEHGMIMPDQFIPLAEESGMIVSIGEWILNTACEQTRFWHEQGFDDLALAVNVSGRQFQQKNLPGLISRILQSSGVDPNKLELEITESIAMQDYVNPEAMLSKLKSLDVKISLDDFGTGWSSLTYLKNFPIDKMKLDQSFVHNLTTDKHDTAICKALITLSRSLGISVLAEGIENQQQLSWMEEQGCDQVQGYFFSKPLPADEFIDYIRQRNGPIASPSEVH